MENKTYRLALLLALGSAAFTLGCSKKAPECDALISSMNGLGTKVEAAQKAADKPDAKPEELVSALRPLANDAKSTANRLDSLTVTVPELQKLTVEFQGFAKKLGEKATTIAEAATGLAGADMLGRALEEAQKQVETAQTEIEKACSSAPPSCVALSEILDKLPAPPSPPDNAVAVEKWSKNLEIWLETLKAVPITEVPLKAQVDAFASGWLGVERPMLSLAKLSDTAKSIETAGKDFDSLIDQANKTIDGANQFCGRK